MSTRINEAVPDITSYKPSGTQNGDIVTVSNEVRVVWGDPVDNIGMPTHLAIRGMMPPIRVMSIDDNFRLLRFTFVRTAVEAAPDLASVDVTVNFKFQALNVEDPDVEESWSFELTHEEGVITSDAVGTTVEVGDFAFRIVGFELPGEKITSSIIAEVGQIITSYMVVTLVDEPIIEPSGPAVFNPANCEVPYVAPILDVNWLADCSIPTEIEPINDCPEIDLPAVGALGLQAITVNDGPPGDNGCNPTVTVSHKYYCVRDCSQVKVLIDRFVIGECHTHLHFRFYMCCPYSYNKVKCRQWVWCPCPDSDPEPEPEPVDDNCPKTDSCNEAPGHWVDIGSEGPATPPCIAGEYYGQMETKCECPGDSSSSSSSSHRPPDDGAIGCSECKPGTVRRYATFNMLSPFSLLLELELLVDESDPEGNSCTWVGETTINTGLWNEQDIGITLSFRWPPPPLFPGPPPFPGMWWSVAVNGVLYGGGPADPVAPVAPFVKPLCDLERATDYGVFVVDSITFHD